MARLYTGRGDEGETDVGSGRERKDAATVEAVGAIDEANAAIGAAVVELDRASSGEAVDTLRSVQADLFALGADIAWPRGSAVLDPSRVPWLERRIDAAEAALPPLRNFVLPGGSRSAAALHLARTVVRRAERRLVPLLGHAPQMAGTGSPAEAGIPYLNRLSDLLFSLARFANHQAGAEETLWSRR